MLDFMGIGAQKAGTTWLFERLRKHPEIHFPHIKEISFWNAHYPRSLKDPQYKRDMNWYRSLFNHWETHTSLQVVDRLKAEPAKRLEYRRGWFDSVMAALDPAGSTGAKVIEALEEHDVQLSKPAPKQGEISPTYCYFEDPTTLPKIREFAPDVRIIYSVRHPFDRAWSSAQMAVKNSEMVPDEASDQWYIDHFRSRLSLKYGDYERALTSWYSAFPKEQILLLRFEDIPGNPHAVLKACCQHIGVQDVGFFDNTPAEKLAEKVFAGSGGEIRVSLLPVLHELYDAKIRLLKETFGIDYTTYPHNALTNVA